MVVVGAQGGQVGQQHVGAVFLWVDCVEVVAVNVGVLDLEAAELLGHFVGGRGLAGAGAARDDDDVNLHCVLVSCLSGEEWPTADEC